MKNFKKLIATLLAVIMVASTAMTASAATVDYTDGYEVDFVEAVDVMSAIGVINGNPDGSFNPTGEVTRAEMAKMVTFILNEGEDVAADYEGTNDFTDCGWHWAKGYIAFAENQGIVDGNGDGTFNPDGSVTGAEGAKMLLTALGYNSETEGYLGTSWASNVITDARSAGLVKDMPKGFSYTAPMTRDQAAQMMFNALKATMVDYSGSGTTVTMPDGTTVTTGSGAIYDRTWGGTSGTNYETGKSSASGETLELCEEYFSDLYISSSSADEIDLLGRDAHTWYYNKTVIGTYATEADFTFLSTEEATTAADFTEAVGDAIKEDQDTDIDPTAVYLNGEAQTQFGAGDAELQLGDTVEVYMDADDSDLVAKVVITRYVYDTIDSFEVEDDIEDSEIVTDGGMTLTYENTIGFQALLAEAEEDKAILVAGEAAGQYPTTVTGSITRYRTGDYIVMDGATYYVTTDAYTNHTLGITEDDNQATIYLADTGYVTYAEDVSSTAADNSMVVVKSYSSLNSDSEIVDMVRGVLSTGEVKAFEVDKAYDAGKAYTYVESDDVYTLTEVATLSALADDGVTTFASTTVLSNTARLTVDIGASTQSVYFDNDVKFIFVDTADDNEVTVYDGVTEFDSAQSGYAVLEKTGSGDTSTDYRIVAVYAVGDNAVAEGAETSSDDIFYIDGEKTGTTRVNGTTYNTYEVYVNGQEQEGLYATSANYSAGFYTAKINDDGAYTFTSFTSDSDFTAVTGKLTANISNRFITIENSSEDFDVSNAKVIDTTDGDYTKVSNLDTNATLTFIYDEDFVVEAIYVVE